ncbi:CHAD domain-containing protein [Neorhizobium lilium]|uniref:CHAD domain-containing protein n=1 Tax=Neorhizobium lilium TaxID=2503024 RepID=A0A3S3S833_9HYPH|nr:CHAD domain-containing protein [Neorhizobium lilium]RWX79153.1 CHAD domain-containing protein [Neorhizobium lilium]
MAYRLRPDRPFTAEFRSAVKSQLSKAIELLEEQPQGPHEAAHDARKKFKRVRALYRLIQPEAKAFRNRENTRIRDMAQTLSAVRDATALVETVDYLTTGAGSPEEVAALTFASRTLSDRRDRIAAEEHDLPARMKAAAASCREAIDALDELKLDDGGRKTARMLAKAWKTQRLRALAALEECHGNAHAEAFHELRKSGQTYWMHLALLGGIWPSAMRAKQEEAKQLVDLLGHEHDLSVLTQLVNESPELFGSSETLARILGAIIARQQSLRQEALPLAEKVFGDQADLEGAIIERLWKDAARHPKAEKKRKPYRPREPRTQGHAEAASVADLAAE